MDVLLTGTFLTAFVAGTITVAVPLLLAGLGEQISERAGVLNLGLEGMMLVGAFVGFAVTLATGSFALGFLAGGIGGIAIAAIMGVMCVMLHLNQIVIGIAITLAMQGATSLSHHVLFARDFPRLPRQPELALPLLADIPILGPSLFRQNAVVYFALALVFALGWMLRNSNIGLNLAAAGEKPAALDVAGVSVTATRMWAVISTGALAGLGGAYMAEVGAGLFIPFMTGGAGFMAIVLAMLARGRPLWVLIGALVVGISTSVTTALQVAGFQIPTDVVQMIPFATIIVVLAMFGRKAGLPAALGLPYHRGAR
jgi:general nucleoside transport system permease protein